MTSKTNPGTTPVYWGFHIGEEDFKKKRYCLLCQVFKPERTHHCSICNLCILNMDHHCPWVDNCIGFYNKKFFIQLLSYFLLTSLCFCIMYIPYSIDIIKIIYKTYKKGTDKNFEKKYYLFLINNILLLGFSVVDFNFLKFHIKLIKSNLTTIETLDNDLMENKKYDMGFETNFRQIFGDNKLLWFLPINLPIGYPIGDGLTWPTKFDIMPLEQINKDNKTIDNCNNIIENKIESLKADMNINKGEDIGEKKNIEKKNSKNIKDKISINRKENNLNNPRFTANFSKYNVVKRNCGNYLSNNGSGYDTNSTKKTYRKSEDETTSK